MAFVFSFWYIVMAVLAIGVVACIVVFFMMDKKDKELIDNFIQESAKNQPAEQPVLDEDVK